MQNYYNMSFAIFLMLYIISPWLIYFIDFPGLSMVKNPPAMLETWVWSLGREDPLEKEMATHPVFLPGRFHGQRNLEGYSPWGHKELDMIALLSTLFIFTTGSLYLLISTYFTPLPSPSLWKPPICFLLLGMSFHFLLFFRFHIKWDHSVFVFVFDLFHLA